MPSFQWSDFIALTNLLVAAAAVFAALMAPRTAWKLTRRSQEEDAKRRDKVNIFGALMQNRHTPQSREAVAALNLIDIAFHDDPEVRRIWREYHGMISNPTFFENNIAIELTNQKLLELQTAMARALNFSIDQFDIARIYRPTWLAEEDHLTMLDRRTRLGALQGQGKTMGVPPAAPATDAANSPDGIYVFRFAGQSGVSGTGLLSLMDETFTAVDLGGIHFHGSYDVTDGRIRGSGAGRASDGGNLVTGVRVEQGEAFKIRFDLPASFADGTPQTVEIGDKTVSVSFVRAPATAN